MRYVQQVAYFLIGNSSYALVQVHSPRVGHQNIFQLSPILISWKDAGDFRVGVWGCESCPVIRPWILDQTSSVSSWAMAAVCSLLAGIYWNTCWKCWKCPNTPFLSWALKWLGFFQGSRTTTPSCAASWPAGHTALLRGRYNIYNIYSIYGKVGVPVLICATMPLLI